jgi:hypothetical protein
MVTEVHIIKDQISKITKAIELRICISGERECGREGGEEGEVLSVP